MASIKDVFSFAPESRLPQQAAARRVATNGRGRAEPVRRESKAGGAGRFGDLGRLFEPRARQWVEATRTRRGDRALAGLAAQVDTADARLRPVKLYPPYPIDEPRRAEAIRRFNGVAAEVARVVRVEVHLDLQINIELSPLSADASTDAAESALAELGRLREALGAARDRLEEAAGVSDEAVATATLDSSRVADQLARLDGGSITRGPAGRIGAVL